MSRVRRGVRTGCATASNPKQPNQDCARGFAPPRRTGASTWAMRAGASWSHANGPARPWPTTRPTAWPRSCAPSASTPPTPSTAKRTPTPQPSRRTSSATAIASPGNWPDPPTRTCHPANTASCGPSAKHSNAAQHSTRHKPPQRQAPFRQLNRGQHHQPPRILLTVPEAARVLAISRSKLYELLVSGEVRSLRIGGSRR